MSCNVYAYSHNFLLHIMDLIDVGNPFCGLHLTYWFCIDTKKVLDTWQHCVCMYYCKVWALDVKRCVYVRDGVSAELPCGKSWKLIPGEICHSASF